MPDNPSPRMTPGEIAELLRWVGVAPPLLDYAETLAKARDAAASLRALEAALREWREADKDYFGPRTAKHTAEDAVRIVTRWHDASKALRALLSPTTSPTGEET